MDKLTGLAMERRMCQCRVLNTAHLGTAKFNLKVFLIARQWWCTPLIPALRRPRQGDLKFETSLVYRASFTTARAKQRNPVLKNQTNQPKRTFLILQFIIFRTISVIPIKFQTCIDNLKFYLILNSLMKYILINFYFVHNKQSHKGYLSNYAQIPYF